MEGCPATERAPYRSPAGNWGALLKPARAGEPSVAQPEGAKPPLTLNPWTTNCCRHKHQVPNSSDKRGKGPNKDQRG